MKTIVVLTDFSKKAELAAQIAIEIALAAKAKVHLLTTFQVHQVFSSDAGVFLYYEDYKEEEKILNIKLKNLVKKLLVKFEGGKHPVISYKSQPGNLAENVERLKPWLMVMGGKSKASTLSHLIFGSKSSEVIDRALCPLLIVPEKAELIPFKRILFATDLDPSEKNSLSFLEEFGNLWNAQIMVLHVSETSQTEDHNLNNIFASHYHKIHYSDVRGADIAAAIHRYAGRESINLIAVSHKKRSVIGQLLHKSVGKDILNYQRIPVLILNKS